MLNYNIVQNHSTPVLISDDSNLKSVQSPGITLPARSHGGLSLKFAIERFMTGSIEHQD